VLLPLLLDRHTHRGAALLWFDSVGTGEVRMRRVVQLGLLRLLCTEAVMGEDVQTPNEAWQAVAMLQFDERIRWCAEPEDLDTILSGLVSGRVPTPMLWTDAYLAAFAEAGGLRLVTFDHGFRSLPGLDCLILDLPSTRPAVPTAPLPPPSPPPPPPR